MSYEALMWFKSHKRVVLTLSFLPSMFGFLWQKLLIARAPRWKMLISKHIKLVPIYVHSVIQRFVNRAHNEFSFTEEVYKNINHASQKGICLFT